MCTIFSSSASTDGRYLKRRVTLTALMGRHESVDRCTLLPLNFWRSKARKHQLEKAKNQNFFVPICVAARDGTRFEIESGYAVRAKIKGVWGRSEGGLTRLNSRGAELTVDDNQFPKRARRSTATRGTTTVCSKTDATLRPKSIANFASRLPLPTRRPPSSHRSLYEAVQELLLRVFLVQRALPPGRPRAARRYRGTRWHLRSPLAELVRKKQTSSEVNQTDCVR